MNTIFQTVRPLKSKRVKEILQDKDSREKFLHTIFTMKDDEVSKSFEFGKKSKVTIKRLNQISHKF